VHAKPVAGLTEDLTDVVGQLVEGIPRPRPVRTAVLETAAIRVDETPQELLGPSINQLLLPIDQGYPPLVLLTWTVLREQPRPSLGVAVDLDPSAVGDLPDTVSRHYGADCADALGDDLRVPRVEAEANPIHAARVSGDTAVAEIKPEEVNVRGW
jgi:hypothetical protein